MTPHPLVAKSIETADHTTGGDGCGCAQRPPKPDRPEIWDLCQYHLGMQDGIEAVIERINSDEGEKAATHPPCLFIGHPDSCAPGRPDRKHPECVLAALVEWLNTDA